MSWKLIEKNSKGYKKYLDNHGNTRYQKPNGEFTNKQGWGGSFSHGNVSKVKVDTAGQEGKGPRSGTVRPPNPRRETRDDLGSYENAVDIIYDEPVETGYIPPVDFPFDGYPLEDYPSGDRLDELESKVQGELESYDSYVYMIETVIYDKDGSVISEGQRHTSRLSNLEQLRVSWYQMMSELGTISSDYGGIAVLETRVKGREF